MKDCKISSVFLELCLLSAGEAVKRHLHVVAQDFWRIFFLGVKLEIFSQQ